MAKFKYTGPEQHVGRFGRLKTGAIVDLWQSEIEFIESRNTPGWERVEEASLEGVGTIFPAKVEKGFDITRINWLHECRAALRRMSRSELAEVAQSMRLLGCQLPPEKESRSFSRDHLFETVYGEAKRLRWDQPGYQSAEAYALRGGKPGSANSAPKSGAAPEKVRAHNEDGTFKADDPSTPEANEAWAEEPKEEAKETKQEPRRIIRRKD